MLVRLQDEERRVGADPHHEARAESPKIASLESIDAGSTSGRANLMLSECLSRLVQAYTR